MAWTFYGEFYDDLRRNVSGVLTLPTAVSICTLGTTSPITLYNGRDSTTATTIPNGPMTTGVPVGSPGIDAAGGTYFYAPVGKYTPVIDGTSYPPITVMPDLDDLAALGGSGTSASGQTLQIKTASARTITNDDGSTGGSMVSATTLADWTVTLNPGDAYRFDAVPFFTSTRAAGVRVGITASGTGVVMGYMIRGPHATETGRSDITEHRETTVTTATNGPQQFNGFASSGSSDTGIEIFGGYVALPSSAPAPGQMKFKFAQSTATSGVTTTCIDLKSCMSLVQVA